MANINLFIKENIKDVGRDIYIVPDIPEKKLNNALKSYGDNVSYESVLALYDDTLFGSASDGMLFTGEKMLHNKYGVFLYSDIKSVKYVENITINDKGKEKKEEWIIIKTKDGKKHKLTYGLMNINKEKFTGFLNKIITEFEEYKEEDQLKEIADMPDELKIAYLKIIVNMTFIDDEEIDEKELAELFLLITRLELNKDSRFVIRRYITEISKDNIETVKNLINIIKENSEDSHHKSLMISLVKDLINVYFSTKDTMDRNFKFLDDNKESFGISDEEIDLAYDTVENDYKLLKEDLDDDTIKKNAKELASKAAAAGVPLAAVYISGSVIGMSAAGITSGLAALGMGMGMTGGLAVVGIIGVLSYKGMKHLTGANELDKYKTRELMLHEVIKQTQKTISLIIDDINYIIEKLNDTLVEHAEQKEKIQKLMKMVAQFQGALKSVDNKSNIYQNSANRLQNPKILDVDRLKELTSEPTKKPLYNFIMENYELKEMKTKDGKKNVYALKQDISTEILDKMAQIFQAIGYFDMGNIVTSKASSFVKGIFG
jgi:uncharacterized coiled-coil protein SlyX